MTDATSEALEEPKKGSKLPLIIGLVVALAGGGGGYFAVSQGLILGAPDPAEAEKAEKKEPSPLGDIAFVPVEPLTISLGRESQSRHLRFHAQLEVAAKYQSDVELMMPRLVDVLNSYLRAVDIRELEERATLMRLRSQMLRRLQIVAGESRIRDLLVMEFVPN